MKKSNNTASAKALSADIKYPNIDLLEENDIPKFDGGYKQELSKKKQFIHFMQKYVKADWCKNLTPEQVELCDKELLLEDYQKRQADLIYKISLDKTEFYVYLIMELQSKVDFTMPFRLLTLVFGLLLQIFLQTPRKKRQRKNFRLPVVIPVLFFNGTGKWTVDTEFKNYLHGSSLFDNYALNFRYYLVDLNQLDNNYILNSNTLIDNILALDKNCKKDALTDVLTLVAQRMKRLDDSDQIDFRRWLEQVLLASTRGSNKETVSQLISTLQKGDEQMVHGLQLTIMEEYDRGMEAGIRDGELSKLIQLVCRKLAKGKTASVIAEELEEDPDVIQQICSAAAAFAPDFDCGKILEKMKC